MSALLDIEGLSVSFATRGGGFKAVDGVSLRVDEGAITGLGAATSAEEVQAVLGDVEA